ncbi:MAG TPA: FAD-dependent oxidoreductase [Polyangia bacterium]|jgi:nitrite reductase (NADH) large subunit|nr:FAD-dependent oxidoreductase [Polyangia bacterium]
MRKKTLAVIGNGMATCRLLDELVERKATLRFEVVVYGEERGGAYNRILLSKVLAGAAPESIVTKPRAWYEAHGIRLVDGAVVKRLDTAGKQIETADGARHRYDAAVIATGSQPTVPPLEGMTSDDGDLRPGVFVYRTMDDCARMRAHARPGDSAIVLGGGLLGLEAAKVLADRGLHVTVIHGSKTLMNLQLDEMGGEMLEREIERCGIFVRTAHTVEAILGDLVVEGVRLDDGRTLAADMVVLACGVRPRVDVARASGIPINRGIIVNDALATEAPGVYAIGECAEHAARTYGIVAPAWEQAAVLAEILSGENPLARYRGSKLYTRLKVAGVDVASMGRVEPELESDEVIQIVETRRGSYRKMIVRDGKLVGALFVGNTEAAASLVQLFDRGDALPADPLEALCPNAAFGATAPADRMVCTCHKVSASRLCEAIAGGACTVEALGELTKAGSGCGSCKPELVQLIAKNAPPPKLAAAG